MFWRNNKTIRPIKKHKRDKHATLSKYAKESYAKATLGGGAMKSAVQLPKGEQLSEWLAVNTVDFFNEISLLFGSIEEVCTKKTCPVMSAGPIKYAWADGIKIIKPVECSAPQYVEYLMTWVEQQLNDEAIFPLQFGAQFPKNFIEIVRNIYKRMFRVYAHIYNSHFEEIITMGAEAHLNTCFKHFLFFVVEFKLVKDKDMIPMKPLIDKWLGRGKESKSNKLKRSPSTKEEKKR
ncbi:hypothetical protein AAMO2058_000502500 [Amorphochlora amoebiformis]|mmetsp:Transcript_20137/g.31964  ORF Transcript_20137/g.31964 Transcript_20137/m.31964 type:complete len:235 (-) Transcript_20137:162-866(-)